MTIQTKFDPGQEVWFMDWTTSRFDIPKEPCRGVINSIKIFANGAGGIVEYSVGCNWRGEACLFPSKDELLKSL